MTSRFNPFAPKPLTGNADASERIKTWVRADMPLDEADGISVTELACAEPGCPPRETVIVIMPANGRWSKARVHKAMSDVSEVDVACALRFAEKVPRYKRLV